MSICPHIYTYIQTYSKLSIACIYCTTLYRDEELYSCARIFKCCVSLFSVLFGNGTDISEVPL